VKRSVKDFKRASTCLNFRIRRTARLVSRYYDDVVRPTGLNIAEFNLLVALAISGEIAVTRFAEFMAMERSALARNLRALERKGLLRIETGQDRRTRFPALTARGRHKLQEALPVWEKAQSALVGALKDKVAAVEQAVDTLRDAVSIARRRER
jgi:DNA-binding MarR family transcriptional regulator